ncbi:hypothetical protein H1R20_g12351, partial [Candolleomyces eurysporus]
MPVQTRSSEPAITAKINAELRSIDAQHQSLLQERKEELKRLEHEYKSNRKALEGKRRKLELAAEQRREKEEERMRKERIRKLEKKNPAAIPGLVKMVGKAVCTPCKDKKIDCYRAPRQLFQPTVDTAPGVLKDFVRCQSCIDTKLKCRTAISSTAPPVRNTASQSKPRMSTINITTATSLAPTPGRSASGAAAGTKRKHIVYVASEEDESHSDSDSGPAPSSCHSTQISKRRKSDVVPGPPPRPRSLATGRFLPAIKKPTGSKNASQSTPKSHSHSHLHPSHPHSNSSSSSSQSEVPSDPSSSTSVGVASEETLKSILDNMNRNHEATMKFFTQFLGVGDSAHAPPPTFPSVQDTNANSSFTSTTTNQSDHRERGHRGSGSGSGGRQSQKATDTQTRRSKNGKRKVYVKLEDELERRDVIDQLATDYEPEIIVIEDDDD